MPSHKANKHGTACEYYLADKYNVRLTDEEGKRLDCSWYDGLRNGTPWEFKATAHKHSDGNPGNFKIYEKYHEKLRQQKGWYGFAVYRIRGTGTQVLKTTAVRASRLPTVRWHGGGDHRGTRQAKVKLETIFRS
ncbi:hypothetical protein RH858_08075 [Halalkaliarchaeum sp. AArc-GB]|uniref:hypothetical protein n=1 Tax=Halalkaliarchaeum sp. AArc-GB TaxID=3074078 RepID=UPI0028599925|nr:hypothetical protein [Halalkaliarchaeum sp. AArc-GB]MDR5673105.1 hypothetical protein [Halalkaliarchaeum sp. AArc-GB]